MERIIVPTYESSPRKCTEHELNEVRSGMEDDWIDIREFENSEIFSIFNILENQNELWKALNLYKSLEKKGIGYKYRNLMNSLTEGADRRCIEKLGVLIYDELITNLNPEVYSCVKDIPHDLRIIWSVQTHTYKHYIFALSVGNVLYIYVREPQEWQLIMTHLGCDEIMAGDLIAAEFANANVDSFLLR
jgi:hypothetical protein